MAGARITTGKIDAAKWGFFAALLVAVLVVIWTDERFLVFPHDPFWKQIASFKYLLLVHGVFGVTALSVGPFQFSDRLRRSRPRLHRWMGRIYVGAICDAAPMAGYIGIHFAGQSQGLPAMMRVEQGFQAGGWLFTTLMALYCILNRNIPAHRA